jgi:hypothetical protein
MCERNVFPPFSRNDLDALSADGGTCYFCESTMVLQRCYRSVTGEWRWSREGRLQRHWRYRDAAECCKSSIHGGMQYAGRGEDGEEDKHRERSGNRRGDRDRNRDRDREVDKSVDGDTKGDGHRH